MLFKLITSGFVHKSMAEFEMSARDGKVIERGTTAWVIVTGVTATAKLLLSFKSLEPEVDGCREVTWYNRRSVASSVCQKRNKYWVNRYQYLISLTEVRRKPIENLLVSLSFFLLSRLQLVARRPNHRHLTIRHGTDDSVTCQFSRNGVKFVKNSVYNYRFTLAFWLPFLLYCMTLRYLCVRRLIKHYYYHYYY